MNQPIQAILIGAGLRGMHSYAPYALQYPDEMKFIAVAEPDPVRRENFAQQHNIPAENQLETWEPLLEGPRLGQVALICTQDQMHTEPTLVALKAGYDVLLEKPMATTLSECQQLVEEAEETGRQLHICHVLRFTKHFTKMREIIQSGVLGQIANISHRENVSYWHMAHSFVRGNWRNQGESSPMILAKCCHDLDILTWLLDDRCEQLSSVGNLMHYRPKNAPEGAPERCLDGCPVSESCPYYAPAIYIDHTPLWHNIAASSRGLERWATRTQIRNPGLIRSLSNVIPPLKEISNYRGWPSSALSNDATPENTLAALRDGPYGRCVYHCDNDVVDHQVVSMQFERNTSVTLTMHGHSHEEGRSTLIEGSRGRLYAEFKLGGSWIDVDLHSSDQHIRYDTSTSIESGHGGGDTRLMAAFVRAIREQDESASLTTARRSLESHLMAFAAEDARLEQRVVRMVDYRL